MRLSRPKAANRGEPTIALINIVFLMLIFFLIAGTLVPPQPEQLELITTREAQNAAPPDTLFVDSDGQLMQASGPVTIEDFLDGMDEGATIRLAADRNLPAARLIEVAAKLREAGAAKVVVVTERSR
ncbi:ExbD/TolR family protein [Nitratireductor basaltis]|uniref:Biopolymer transport protein ExbD/TolR n=1 Tax=Nitratireductor basaltis TaxID=472175 RepID=A0A084UA30_9HYPH|nr:biopolymer transporter ExbD [Nitratireductor basaltis]KFB09816.1 Biopolymer transport protein ExbD/TolR precursor [Nitratireductor basaltis]